MARYSRSTGWDASTPRPPRICTASSTIRWAASVANALAIADRVTLEAAMAKAFATEAAQRIVDDAVQILGGRGVLASHPVDRLYRAVRALRIYEGTTEIQHLIVAGHLLKRAGEGGAA